MKFKMLICIVLVLGIIGCSRAVTEKGSNGDITVFKSSGCGCCDMWSQYIGKEGFNVNTESVDSMENIKSEFKIPDELQSCHTAKIGNYFVEGHMPSEAIERLIAEEPNILGIAIPGMPPGSPGMPGKKNSQWIIYAVNLDGSISEYMRV